METYHKIQTVYKRDPENNYKTLLDGEFSKPEFEYLQDNEWVFTEKVDGTNIRIIWDGENQEFTIKGKTDKAQIPKFLLEDINKLLDKKKFDIAFDTTSVTLYGEGYGAKIQKGGGNYIPNKTSFILFDVKIGNWWLQRNDVEGLGEILDLDIVPIIGRGTLKAMVSIVKDGYPSFIGTQIAEGIVARPKYELFDRSGKRVITKVKYKDFER